MNSLKKFSEYYFELTSLLRNEGFQNISAVNMSPVQKERVEIFDNWIKSKKYGTMHFFDNENYQEAWINPCEKYEFAKNVVAAVFPYNSQECNSEPIKLDGKYKISRFAHNLDYHNVLGKMLEGILIDVGEKFPGNNFACQVDSGPLAETYWTEKAGAGVLGKNGLIYSPGFGSWVFIVLIISDFEIPEELINKLTEENHKDIDFCSNCDLCIEACPTNAIYQPYRIDASRCISYLTIEHKGSFDENTELHGWLFGCDICQQVCPRNKTALITEEKAFHPSDIWQKLTSEKFMNMSQSKFKKLFQHSPMKRTGLIRLQRNLQKLKS